MNKVPRWARILLVVVAVVVTIGLVAPYFLDADRYRGTIISAIEKETGRKASIGKIRAKLIPRVGFVIENFSLGNPQGFGEGNLLTVEAIRGSLAWGPLLFRREFQLSAVELVGPKILLLENERGEANYEFTQKEKKKAAPSDSTFKLADIDSIELTEVDVTLGTVMGRKRMVPTIRAWKIDADLGDVALDSDRIKQWKADVDLDGVQLEIPGLKGPIEFTSGSFTLREGKAEAKFKGRVGKAADVNGTLQVANVEKGVAQFEVSTPLLDLEQLSDPKAKTAPSPAVPASRKSQLVAQGRVHAERLRYASYEGTGAHAELRIFTDRMEAWPVSLGFYGGTIGVSVRVDKRQSPQRFSANVEVRKVDVAKLAEAAGAQKKVTGTGEVTAQLFGSLGPNLMNSLTGSGNFAARDGKLPGFHMGGFTQQLAKMQNFLTFGQGGKVDFGSAIPYSAITGDLNLGGGRVSSSRIRVESPALVVDMSGSFGLDQTLDYSGNAVMEGGGASSSGGNNPLGAITGVIGGVMKQTVGRVTVPFAVKGTFDNPKVQPGRGIPTISTSAPASSQQGQTQQQPQKKKSIFDIFKKP